MLLATLRLLRKTIGAGRSVPRVTLLVAVAAAAVPLAACTPTPPGACAPLTKTLAGGIAGGDGNYVNVMLGFDILDASNHVIGQNGCGGVVGYGATVHLNYCLSGHGAVSSAGVNIAGVPACVHTGSTKSWWVQLPANAAYVYVEAYPKRTSSRPAIGDTDYSHYGMSYRRAVPITGTLSSTNLVLPTICDTGGPNMTGGITGRIYRNGVLWKAHGGSVHAWSIEGSNSPVLGMGLGSVNPNTGTYSVNFLTVMSHYTLIANVDGVGKQFINGPLPVVGPCAWTHYDLYF
jgi:hypothetical protein